MLGQTLGNYKIAARLGSGAMGEVFLAEHLVIARRVAIKVLKAELTTNPEQVARFLDEARAMSLIRHPGIVEVFDCDRDPGGRVYLVMEYLEGKTLAARLQQEPCLPWPIACELGEQMAGALRAAHDQGIIHRDIKPENVFLCPDPARPSGSAIKVLDFGIAKLRSGKTEEGVVHTAPGILVGTPDYMAPEQCMGNLPLDHRADIYGLGCVLFRMIRGQLPFVGSHFRDVIAAHMFSPPPPLGPVDPPAPAWLESLVEHMLAKSPQDRPPSMAAVAETLARAAHEPAAARWFSGADDTRALVPVSAARARVRRAFTRAWWPAVLVGAACAAVALLGLWVSGAASPRGVPGTSMAATAPPLSAPAPIAVSTPVPVPDRVAADAATNATVVHPLPVAPAAKGAPGQPEPPGRRRARPAVEMDGLVDL